MGRGRFGLEFHHDGEFGAQLETLGQPPLPPYVRRTREAEALDRERYQTVYAAHPGAIAAPTAGFHFTEELFAKLGAQRNRAHVVDAACRAGNFPAGASVGRLKITAWKASATALNAATAAKINRTKQPAIESSPSVRRARARWNGSRGKRARWKPTRASPGFTSVPAIGFACSTR